MALPRSKYVQDGQEGVYHCFSRSSAGHFSMGPSPDRNEHGGKQRRAAAGHQQDPQRRGARRHQGLRPAQLRPGQV